MDKRIIKEDIETLKMLISRYIKAKQFDKASECKIELERLKGKLNEKN